MVPSDEGSLFGRPGRWRTTVGVSVVGVVAVVAVAVGLRPESPYPYLLPWIVLTAAALVAILLTPPPDRRDDPLDPIVVAVVTFFAPFSVVGGLLLAGGWATTSYTDRILDPRVNLPLAQVYMTVGVVALALGTRLGVARRLAGLADRRLPSLGLRPNRIAWGVVALHAVGLVAAYWSFRDGFGGYQTVSGGPAGAAPAYLATILVPARIAVGMMWALEPRRSARLVALVSVAALPVEMALGASRATVVVAALAVGFGALAGGWRPRFGRVVLGAVAAVVVLSFSVSFATSFRALKSPAGVERTVGLDDQLRFAADALGETVRRGPLIVPDALETAAARLESTGQVAVVVSQYRSLRDEEIAVGIDDSVVDSLVSGLAPRLLWPGKPDPPDPRALSAIYFPIVENSYATTPVTDLLRNFGPVGVPVGMGVLGVALGVLGGFRRARASSIATNMVVGAILIRAVSYEGFFGAIVSDSVRIGLVAAAGAVVLRALSGRPGDVGRDGEVAAAQTGVAVTHRAVVVSVDLSQRGGHQGVAAYLQDCLERAGWSVTLVSLATSSRDRNSMCIRSPRSWRGPTVSEERFDGRSYRHVGSWLAEVPTMRARPRAVLDRELAGHDVVVVGVGSPFWALAVPPGLRRRTIVEFVTRYDDEVVSALETAVGWRRWFWRAQRRVVALQERRALETAAAVVVPSGELAEWARKLGAHDVTVAPHAIGEQFQPDPDATVEPVVLAVARWTDPRKNLGLLLDAFEHALATDDAVGTLVLAGTPPDDPIERSIAERVDRLGRRVEFAGEVSGDVLVEMYQTARMLVLASDQEGFGLPPVEAMACGCPVIATRSGGSELTVVDGVNGLLVPRRDRAALATAIVALATDDDLRARLRREGLRAASGYRVDAVAPVLDQVADRVVARASSASRATMVDA